MRHALALASLALLFACSEPAPHPAPAEPPAAEPTPDPAAEQAALDAATAAAQRYGGELKGRLQSAMQEGGPPTAITVVRSRMLKCRSPSWRTGMTSQ